MTRTAGNPRTDEKSKQRPLRRVRNRVSGADSGLGINILSIGGIIALWWTASHLGWIKPLFLPKPESIWFVLREAMNGDEDGHGLWTHIGWSLYRILLSFALAVLIGIPVGIAMGVSRLARGILDPVIEFYRPLPPLAYLPLMIVWFGIGEVSKIMLLSLAIFAPVALSSRAGASSVSHDQIRAARSLGASRFQIVLHVIVPAALPDILVGLRIGLGVGWTTLVAAEIVAADAGLGKLIFNASNFLRTDVVILGILLIGLFAALFELLLRAIERWAVPWKGRL